MPPSATQISLLSPAELAYLHSSLSHAPPIRPDGRSSTQFRPLVAETDVLPGTNGSARICFVDGTEAIAGVKAEVEKAGPSLQAGWQGLGEDGGDAEMGGTAGSVSGLKQRAFGEKSWVETSIEIPGYRDDDALPVFLAAMLNEALLATGELELKLAINTRFHWRLYIDILLLSPPTSYPIPLLSLTTHLALLSTRLPALISEGDEDPLFNDDWDAAVPLYPSPSTPLSKSASSTDSKRSLPPITLLVASVGKPPKVLFDPSREEIAVADTLLAVSLGATTTTSVSGAQSQRNFQLLSVRTIDPPARTTGFGVKDSENPATIGLQSVEGKDGVTAAAKAAGREDEEGVWKPPRGGMSRGLVAKVVAMCVSEGGVAEEVLAGLEAFKGGEG